MDLPAELAEDLEIACMDALRGDPPGPAVAARLQLAAQGVLAAHGVVGARVVASSTRKSTTLEILLPKPDKTVQRVVLNLGSS